MNYNLMPNLKDKGFLFLVSILFLLGACSTNETGGSDFQKPHDPNSPVTVTGIGPLEGGLGTRVVVTGTNFGTDTAKVKLFFNDKESLILKIQSNAIYAMVPKQPGDLSTIKVMVEEKEDANGKPLYKEHILKDKQFKYNLRASVTTVAGVFGISELKDGPALEATFKRPVFIEVIDEETMLITDDSGDAIRMLSLSDGQLVTVAQTSNPWQSAMSLDKTTFFCVEQNVKPILFKALYKGSEWKELRTFYDQKDANGDYIVGGLKTYGITADDKYVYVLTAYGRKLVRVDQESGDVELMGENLDLESWSHLAYNPKNGYIYVSGEDRGRLYRFDPKKPTEKAAPWLTLHDMEWVVGTGKGDAKEGNGKSAQLGSTEGLCADRDGNVYLSDYRNDIVWKIDTEFNATIFAGTPGTPGYKDGKPKESLFDNLYDVAVSDEGILYVADTNNRVIRCIAIQ